MKKILINDGIHPDGKAKLEAAGFEVHTDKIAQEDLMEKLPAYDAIVVRSATKVRTDLIDNCPNLKVIARGGVGLDNIDVAHAKSKDITVINTPAASSAAVAAFSSASFKRSCALAFGRFFLVCSCGTGIGRISAPPKNFATRSDGRAPTDNQC